MLGDVIIWKRKNSNTTLVKVKYIFYTQDKLSEINSNTTLVKVKFL